MIKIDIRWFILFVRFGVDCCKIRVTSTRSVFNMRNWEIRIFILYGEA